ncbi:MAG: 4-hydroxy-tetrahydrodipicolinate reductase [Calditrichaeota bacterium]|nr:4-hydroxy-tetrahydrodipicolinate reductase [Calditrichota bacterium]
MAESTSPINVAVFGAAGRMGRTVLAALAVEDDIAVAHGIDVEANAGRELAGVTIEEDSASAGLDADVWVDVSLADAAVAHARRAQELAIPIVIGATGFSDEQAAALARLSNAHIIAPNLSPGVNVVFELAPKIAEALGPGYDTAIVETHHRHKLDRPSGTAKRIRDRLRGAGVDAETASVRVGEVVGEHRVLFAAEGEVIELVHRADSRLAFARGVAPAVRFLAGKVAGSFTMADVLDL